MNEQLSKKLRTALKDNVQTVEQLATSRYLNASSEQIEMCLNAMASTDRLQRGGRKIHEVEDGWTYCSLGVHCPNISADRTEVTDDR